MSEQMNPIPLYQVLEFAEWLKKHDPDFASKAKDSGYRLQMAGLYLRSADFYDSLKAILQIFQVCPQVSEPTARSQMHHFAHCGRCLYYIDHPRLSMDGVPLHPLLMGFSDYIDRRKDKWPKLAGLGVAFGGGLREDHLHEFGRLINIIGDDLEQAFDEYLREQGLARDITQDYEQDLGFQNRRSGGAFFARGVDSRQSETSNDQPLGLGEYEVERLARSLEELLEGSFYDEQVRGNPEIRELFAALGVPVKERVQALEFLSWLQEKHPRLDILASVPTAEVRELVLAFCEEKNYQNGVTFSRAVLGWLHGDGTQSILWQLLEIGRHIRGQNRPFHKRISPLERYQTIPYHAMFLFLSAGNFPSFIREYWEDLNYLTGDDLDVFYSFEDLERRVSGFQSLDQFRSIQIERTALPALMIWRDTLAEACVVPLQQLSHREIFNLVQIVVERIAAGKNLREICQEACASVEMKTEALTPGTRITINGGEVTMRDKIDIKADHILNTGNMNIGVNNAINDLRTAGQAELAQALERLNDAIQSSHHIPAEQKQEQAELVKTISEEAAKPKPNKTLLKSLGDGLLDALKAVPDVAKAVAVVAPLLAKLFT